MQSRICILFYSYNLHGGASVCKGEGVAAPKAVERGDKRTRRFRARVLALRENPRRVRVRVSTLQERLAEAEYSIQFSETTPRRERVLDRWTLDRWTEH
jgi:hypothetical protein